LRWRESTRLVNKELSDLWKVRTPEGNSISGPFRPEELAAALRRLKADLPNTVSRKHAYVNDLAIMHADGDCQAVEGVLSKGMATVDEHI